MNYSMKRKVAQQTWRDALPFGALITLWGLVNVWMFAQVSSTAVLPEIVDTVWMVNTVLFIVSGLGVVVYLTVKMRNQMSWFEKTLNTLPCSLFIAGPDRKIEFVNHQARSLIKDGSFEFINDKGLWTEEKVHLCGIEFPGVFSYDNCKYALHEMVLLDAHGRTVGNVVMIFDVTNLVLTNRTRQEVAASLAELKNVLNETSAVFSDSMKALAKSTVNQAKALQGLAEYLYSISTDVELDTHTFRDELHVQIGKLGEQNNEHNSNLDQLKKSVVLMGKTHEVAQTAAEHVSKMNA